MPVESPEASILEQPPLAPSPSAAAEPPIPLPGIRAWLGALRVVSVLAAVGFIAKLAHEQMLGIQITDWSVLDLSLFAGRWIVDTLTSVLNMLAQWHYLGLILILIALLPALTMMFADDSPRVLKWARVASLGLAAVALSFVIVHDEVPMFSLANWLTNDLPSLASPAHAGHLGSREKYVRYIYFLSKTNVQDVQLGQMKAAALAAEQAAASTSQAAAQPDVSLLDSLSLETASLFPALVTEHPMTAGNAADLLGSWYSIAFLICTIALFTCYVFVLKGGHDLEDEMLATLYYMTAFVLLPVACALLPYMYGKLICSSQFPTAIVNPLTADSGAKADGESYKGILIGQAEKDYTLLSVDSGATQTRIFAEPGVKEISLLPDPNRDIVSYVLTEKAMARAIARARQQADAAAAMQANSADPAAATLKNSVPNKKRSRR